MTRYCYDFGAAVNGDGSPGSPLNTYVEPPTLGPGDELCFRRGMVQPLGNGFTGRILVTRSGAPGNPIRIRAYWYPDGSDNPELAKPLLRPSAATLADRMLYLFTGVSDVEIEDLAFDGAYQVQNASQRSAIEHVSGARIALRRIEVARMRKYRSYSGSVSAAAPNSLTDSSANFSANQFNGQFIRIKKGLGENTAAQVVASNTSQAITITGTWEVTPDASSEYEVMTTAAANGFSFGSVDTLTVEDCVVDDCYDDNMNATCTNAPTIRRNRFSRPAQSYTNAGDCFQLAGACNGFLIEGNVGIHNDFEGKQVFLVTGATLGTGGVFRRNVALRPHVTETTGGPCLLSDAPNTIFEDNIAIGGACGIGAIGPNAIIRRNRIERASVMGIYLNVSPSAAEVSDNLVMRCPNGVYADAGVTTANILQNTFVECATGVNFNLPNATQSTRNNLFVSCPTAQILKSGSTYSNNVYIGATSEISWSGAAGAAEAGRVVGSLRDLTTGYAPTPYAPWVGAGTFVKATMDLRHRPRPAVVTPGCQEPVDNPRAYRFYESRHA